MIDITSEHSGLDQQNNRRILEAALGHLYPLKPGPQSRTLRDIVDQLHRENEASASLINPVAGMHEAKRLAVMVKQGHG
jgi:hypothetical protein